MLLDPELHSANGAQVFQPAFYRNGARPSYLHLFSDVSHDSSSLLAALFGHDDDPASLSLSFADFHFLFHFAALEPNGYCQL